MRLALLTFTLVFAVPQPPAQTPQRPPITSIAFFRAHTTDVARAEAFYGGLLALPESHAAGDMVFAVNHHQWLELDPSAAADPADLFEAIGLTTTDVTAMAAYLHARGIEPLGPPVAGALTVKDPEGNTVVFVERGSHHADALAAAAATLSPAAPSRRILHVGFAVHDQAAEDAFWKGVLGFHPYWSGGGHPPKVDWASIQVPDGTDWVEFMLRPDMPHTRHDLGGADHVSLGVERMQTAMAALQKNGCAEKMCRNISVGGDGRVLLNIVDPDQTRIEFMEFTPTLEPCCTPYTGKHPSASDPD